MNSVQRDLSLSCPLIFFPPPLPPLPPLPSSLQVQQAAADQQCCDYPCRKGHAAYRSAAASSFFMQQENGRQPFLNFVTQLHGNALQALACMAAAVVWCVFHPSYCCIAITFPQAVVWGLHWRELRSPNFSLETEHMSIVREKSSCALWNMRFRSCPKKNSGVSILHREPHKISQ